MGVYDWLEGLCPVCGKVTRSDQLKWFPKRSMRTFLVGDRVPLELNGEYAVAPESVCDCHGDVLVASFDHGVFLGFARRIFWFRVLKFIAHKVAQQSREYLIETGQPLDLPTSFNRALRHQICRIPPEDHRRK